MSRVYLVEDIKSREKLVVKERLFLEDTGLNIYTTHEIFFREAELMCQFDHPGLPKVYGVFRENEKAYLVMEYIEGNTLETIINSSEDPVAVEQAVKWTVELAEIISYLHSSFDKPVVYRDLKPSNIIITPEGKEKLIDFGTVRYYNPNKEVDTDTFRLGSPGYAPPEQYEGGGQTTPRTDVFSLGVILYQMLTKYDPTVTPLEFAPMNVLNPSIPEKLENIISHAIKLNPLKRYENVLEFKEELEKYLGIFSPSGTPAVKLDISPERLKEKKMNLWSVRSNYFIIASLILILVLNSLNLIQEKNSSGLSLLVLALLFVSSLTGFILSIISVSKRDKKNLSVASDWNIAANTALILISISFLFIILKKLF